MNDIEFGKKFNKLKREFKIHEERGNSIEFIGLEIDSFSKFYEKMKKTFLPR